MKRYSAKFGLILALVATAFASNIAGGTKVLAHSAMPQTTCEYSALVVNVNGITTNSISINVHIYQKYYTINGETIWCSSFYANDADVYTIAPPTGARFAVWIYDGNGTYLGSTYQTGTEADNNQRSPNTSLLSDSNTYPNFKFKVGDYFPPATNYNDFSSVIPESL